MTHTVEIVGMQYVPTIVMVNQGDVVRWLNSTEVNHTVTADYGDYINSPQIVPGGSWEFKFAGSKKSNYAYHCSNHPHMKGNVVVN